MDLRIIPRTYVSVAFGAMRRPVDWAEKLLWPDYGQRPWPPRLIFDGIEADAKTLVGAVLSDDVLIDAGRRQQVKVAELRRAEELDVYAEQTREQAEDKFEARRQENQRQIEEAAEREQKQTKAAEKRAAEREKVAKKKAAAEAKAASKVEEAVDDALDREEREARLQAISKERRAAAEKRAAITVDEGADRVEAEIARSKSARRAGS